MLTDVKLMNYINSRGFEPKNRKMVESKYAVACVEGQGIQNLLDFKELSESITKESFIHKYSLAGENWKGKLGGKLD